MKTKTKITVAVVSVLSVVALAGTGYAGWVISQEATKDKTGNVIVYMVKNNGVDVTEPVFVKNKDNIIWGTTTQDKTTAPNSWFSIDSVENEFFQPEVTFTVSNKDTTDPTEPVVTAELSVVAKAGKENLTSYEECIAAGLIKGVTSTNTATIANKKLTLTKETKEGTKSNEFSYKLAVTEDVFGWGDHFKVDQTNLNPINFYNAHKGTDTITSGYAGATTYFDDANKVMNKIYTLNGMQFKITINASHGTSATKGK